MENKGMKILVHASAFFAPYLVPILMFLVASFITDDDLVKRVAIQAVLFQLIIGALITVSLLLSIILIGIPFVIGFSIMWFAVPIIGIVKVLNGEHYEYPILKHLF